MDNPAFDPKEFLTELCRYYLLFLQSDFSNKRLPARKVAFRNKDGLLTDISLARYPGLNHTALDLLTDGFRRNPFQKIDRYTFASTLPEEPADSTKEDGPFYGALYEMWKNKQLLDRQDFYLSFLGITHNNVTYPIFYLPIGVELTAGSFSFELDPVLLINSKAIEYVSQEFAEATKKEWKIDLPPRHIYLSNFEQNGDLLGYLRNIMTEVTSYFGLDELDLPRDGEAGNDHVSISTQCYLSLCDKSDESIINDYEELLTLAQAGCDTRALDIFTKLSSDYLFENPESFESQIEEHFDSLPVSERLVHESPIPLNSEQIQILKAIDTKGCNRIIVEGPPGTGKSHTIAAIIYCALLKRQSVLMVSDQPNALDVVESMINDVLEKARPDSFIQNPIVRLGRKENTFAVILREVNYSKIKARYNALKKHSSELERDIERTRARMQKAVDEEVDISSSLGAANLAHLVTYEEPFREIYGDILDMEELESVEGSPELMCDLGIAVIQAEKEVKTIKDAYGLDLILNNPSLEKLRTVVGPLYRDMLTLRQTIHDGNPCLLLGEEMTDEKLQVLERCLESLALLDKPVTGYLFSGSKLRRLDDEFKKHFVLSDICLKRDRERLSKELQIYRQCQRLNVLWSDLKLDTFFLIRDEYRCGDLTDRLKSLLQSIDVIRDAGLKLPLTCSRIGTSKNPFPERLTALVEEDPLNMKKYLTAYFSVLRISRKSEEDTFVEDGRRLRKGIVARMAAMLDESVVTFRETSKNDAEELRKLIHAKKQIPRGYLQKLVAAFPCLIVSIRELGEFIPLEPDIFDIAIIDEASQVSIAQAFPVILRAKKIIVLGDPKQFNNVKSHNASVSINNYLFNRVKTAFDKSIAVLDTPQNEMVRDKVNSFNIKNSILDFLRNISNYQCSLKKHFRSYGELIAYSNEMFYHNSLQVMKIRGKPIRDVIQFHRVSPAHSERYRNANETEARFILAELKRLKRGGFAGTVGVVTPFTNQQKLMSNIVYASSDWRFFDEKFKFKTMTFDSCQGNEKDIIYYSMVEKEHEDILRYVFPIKLENIAQEEDGNLKAQRLNVGLSRAKESVRFVLSKDAESIRGEIGKAIRYYKSQLEEPDVLSRTDASSPMEPVLYEYITQTLFYRENTDRIELIPQFNIGQYIKQLNPYARIPNYRSDFLMLYREATGKDRMVILEYDGFEYHFKDNGHVDAGNFERFYIEEDIERRRTIESYGYHFIRFNKFVLGNDPIGYIDRRFEGEFGKSLKRESRAHIVGIHERIETGTHCVECGTHKCPDELGGSSMETGTEKVRLVGRNGNNQPVLVRPLVRPSQEAVPKCPRCQSAMVLRKGAYGAFYGCSKYPDCKGTKRTLIRL